jgi:hypothetical protein
MEILIRKSQLDRMREAFLYRDDNSMVEQMKNAFAAVNETCEYSLNNPGLFLRAYLNLAKEINCKFKRAGNFNTDYLEHYNMTIPSNGKPQMDSKGATGSPLTEQLSILDT